ncbi:hypothetical protein JCM15519_11570 [Fundidesulfovibrio butyratiphilus]
MDTPFPPRPVLHVIDSLDCGGAQELLVLLARVTPQDRYPTSVVVIQPFTGMLPRLQAEGVKVFCLNRQRPSILNPLKFLRYTLDTVRDLRRICLDRGVRVVHCHLSDAEFTGILTGRLCKVDRVLDTVHTPLVLPKRGRFDPRTMLRRLLTRLLLNRADWVIAVSSETARTLTEMGVSPRRIRVVENGIDIAAYTLEPDPRLRTELGLEPEDRVLLSVGRLTEQKGHVHLLDALPAIVAREPRTRLVVLGEGELRAPLERQAASLGMTDHVRFVGVRPDVARVLALAEIFAFPSLWEGTSLALLEAMAATKPIVATDIDGNRPVLAHERDCLLVPPADPAALAGAVLRLLNDRELARTLARTAHQEARRQFDVRAMAATYQSLWNRSPSERDTCGDDRREGEHRQAPPRLHASPRSPRVAVTGLRGVPATWGGVERQCEELYSRLAKQGFDVTLYARKGYVERVRSPYRGIRVVTLPTMGTKHMEAFVHTFLAILHMAFHRQEIIHIYSQGPFVLSPLAKLTSPRAKLFFTCGGLDWQRKKWSRFAAMVIKTGEWLSARLANTVVVVSRALADYYRDRYGVDAVCIVNGVDIPAPTPFDKAAGLGLEAGNYVLFVGRLVPEKRIEDLVAALRRLPGTLRLAVVGGSAGALDYEERLHQAAGSDPRIVFTGYRFGEELAALYSNALAYVTASELEGLPLTLLEAMSHGLPCLASDIPPHAEVLSGNTGRLFPTHDVTALARGLAALATADRADLRREGEICRERVREHFSWDQAANALARAYRASLEDNA